MAKKTVDRAKQAEQILAGLRAYYGPVECTLDFIEDPWRLMVGAILAAQCTDERVNKVTPALFERYPTVYDMAEASPELIEPYIKTCGLFRNKAKGIYGSAVRIVRDYGGEVPHDRESMLKLPGVGRKIANLLIGDAFGGQAIVVDTHCGRISRLMGLTAQTDPVKIEKDLVQYVPEDSWSDWGHLLVTHGREICIARRPNCPVCPVRELCDHGRAAIGLPVDADVKGAVRSDEETTAKKSASTKAAAKKPAAAKAAKKHAPQTAPKE